MPSMTETKEDRRANSGRPSAEVAQPPVIPIQAGENGYIYATFVAGPEFGYAGGRNHTIQFKPREEHPEQPAGALAPRLVETPGTGKRIKFSEGFYITKDQAEIDLLLNHPRYSIDYGPNPDDPTGFWEKSGLVQVEHHRTTKVIRPTGRIAVGGISSGVAG
jgi:hypothetical protein